MQQEGAAPSGRQQNREDLVRECTSTTLVLLYVFPVRYPQMQSSSQSNNKIEIVAQGADHGDGHSCFKKQPTMKLTTLIHRIVLRIVAQQVSSMLIVVFSFVLAIWSKWPHNGHGDNVMVIPSQISNGFGSYFANHSQLRVVAKHQSFCFIFK